ncbi:ATP-dependent DNA ligase [Candidatus Pacearchaeota archaeon]|nr:ATP-dependent DNA ligase [Candidatus Pacearchaeota archaeon]
MLYKELCETYEELQKNPSRLKKIEILSKFLKKLKHESNKEIIYLIQGKAFPDYSEKEFGISDQLCIKALEKASGISKKEIIQKWKKIGDLGLVAEQVMSKKKQNTLFSHKLTTQKVLDNLKKLPELVGKGTVNKKMSLISELLTSASGIEAKYIIRTLLNDLRIGVASGTIRDAISDTCFNNNNVSSEEIKQANKAVQESYDKANDFALVFDKAIKGIKSLHATELKPGHPLKVMLALKAQSIEDGFKRVGKPAAIEYKYDGFRMLINKDEKGTIKIFTRRLDEVTKQFPDVVKYIKENIKAKSFILDSEAVGYDPKTKKYKAFQDISQRIRRKYDIEKLEKKLPVEINVFDILYFNGKSMINEPFEKRTELIRKIIHHHPYHIRTAEQIITSDEKVAEKFYKQALKDNQEGIMIKNLQAEYKPGARVGFMLKLKPAENEFDLVITGAEYGTGKRGGILSSFTLSCYDPKNDKYLEIGKASTGLKEKEEEGLSYIELTKLVKPLITYEHGKEVKIKPKIIVTILFQNIQKSPTYESGFALRFPRVTALRHDKSLRDVATLEEIEKEFKRMELKIEY